MSTTPRIATALLRIIGERDRTGGRARWTRASITAFATAGARGMSILTGLVSVPLTLRYLGTERYGVWMTISSAIVLLVFADFGLGSGVVNAVSEADGAGDRGAATVVVSSAFFMLLGVAAFVVVLFLALSLVVPWHIVFSVNSPEARAELLPTIAVIVSGFAISLPLGVVQRVQIGYQEGYRNSLWQMAGNLIGLCGILVAIHHKATLPCLVLCITGGQALALSCNFLNHFLRVRPWLRPRIALVRRSTCRNLLRVGLVFCGLTLAALLGTSTDNLIIARVCGSSAVARYDVLYKLTSLTLIIQYFTVSLWPAFSEAQTRGDGAWLRSAFRRTTGGAAVLAVLMCAALLLLGRHVIQLWVGPELVPSFALLGGFCCYRLFTNISETAVSLLNTAPLLNTHILIAGTAASVAVCAKTVAAHYAGIEGVIWATAATYGVLFSLPAVITADVWSARFARQPLAPSA
jgi:O-antigen/teichoic acid export membrane protein